MKLSDFWLTGVHGNDQNPEVEDDVAAFLQYWLKGLSISINTVKLERIESGTWEPTLAFTGQSALYWKIIAHIIWGFPPRLYQTSEEKWVGLFVETSDGFQVNSSLYEYHDPNYYKDYQEAVTEYEKLKALL